MKVIIDPYRGGKDTGELINGQYEKNILLNASKKLQNELKNIGIDSILIRENDISLTDDERNSIINEMKNKEDLIIQNRISSGQELDIIYPLRSGDYLSSYISNRLNKNNITVNNYYQRRLPTNTKLDYYSIIRNTTPNETIIIEYPKDNITEDIIKNISQSIKEYINNKKTYKVQKGDTLYKIAKEYNTTVEEIKKLNNLISNNLSIGQQLVIPLSNNEVSPKYIIHKVQKGDTLYKIAKENNTTVEEIKQLNNLTTNILSINQDLKIPR